MKSRPPGYEQAVSIDLLKSPVLAVVLTLAGFGLFFLLGWLGLRLLTILRPDVQSLTLRVSGLGSGLLFLAGLIVLIALTVTLHELVHGVFFWLFTGERPKLGWKWLYAYASAPDWYLPRNQHLVVAAAPLVLITAAGLTLLTFAPEPALPAILFATVANAAGSIGDVVVLILLLFQPQEALVQDTGDAIHVYK